MCGMKTIAFILIFAMIMFAAAVGAAGFFYWKYLRGAWPAFQQPPQDITKLIQPDQPNERPSQNETGLPLKLLPGFSVSIFARNLKAPRVLARDPAGNILTSITSEGKVVALSDKNNDGIADETVTVADGLNRPHGLAFRCVENFCKLYIAESDKVASYDYDEKNLKISNKKKIADLPDGGRHFTRTIAFTPLEAARARNDSLPLTGFMPSPDEDKLLISVGSSCDVCDEEDWRRTKILSVDYNSGDLKTFAYGLRNSVFMAIHPVTGKIWATEMGRDFLGDNLPPDEINIIEEGKNYGWPICYGKNIHDTSFDKKTYIRNPCMEPFETESYIDIPAHSSPLGLAFIPEEGWPQDWWYNLLVAYHGSWNRTEPTGYKIVRYKLDAEGRYLGEEDFASGWLTKDGNPRTEGTEQSSYDGALGRPADILAEPGGVIYVSDDKAGVIYKIILQK